MCECGVWVWVVEDVCVDSRAVKWVSSVNNPSKSLRLLRSSKEFQISIIRNFSLLLFFSSLLHFTFVGPSSLFNYAKTTRDYKISVWWRFEEPSKISLKFEFELKNKKKEFVIVSEKNTLSFKRLLPFHYNPTSSIIIPNITIISNLYKKKSLFRLFFLQCIASEISFGDLVNVFSLRHAHSL